MKKIKKRGAVYGVVALLLCTAAYLNWSYVEPPEGGLQADDVTKIRDIVVSETGMSAGQIKIVEAGS